MQYFDKGQYQQWIRKGCWIFFVIGVIMGTKGYATTQDSIGTDYTRGLNTELWEWNYGYHTYITPAYSLQINGILSTSRLAVTPTQDKWKDKHQFNMGVRHTVNSELAVQFLPVKFCPSEVSYRFFE